MKHLTSYFLNPVLLLTLSLMLVFPVVFSGLIINSEVPSEEGIVLGTVDSFGGNLSVFDTSEDGGARRAEFTVFPGQETYYRDFLEFTNDGRSEERFRVELNDVKGEVPWSDIGLSFGRGRSEVILSPGESVSLDLVIHGRDLEPQESFKASLVFTVIRSK